MVEPESSRPSRAPPPVDRYAGLLSDFAAADGPRTPRHNARLRQPRRGSGALSALPHQERLFGQRLPWWHLRGLRIVRFEIELIWCALAQHELLRRRVVGPGAVPRTYSAVPSCSKSPRPQSTGVVAPRDSDRARSGKPPGQPSRSPHECEHNPGPRMRWTKTRVPQVRGRCVIVLFTLRGRIRGSTMRPGSHNGIIGAIRAQRPYITEKTETLIVA